MSFHPEMDYAPARFHRSERKLADAGEAFVYSANVGFRPLVLAVTTSTVMHFCGYLLDSRRLLLRNNGTLNSFRRGRYRSRGATLFRRDSLRCWL
jgi:hypothetical protein